MAPDKNHTPESPLLTERQWQSLTDPPDGMKDNDRRTHQSRARQRIRDIISDFTYFLACTSAEERSKIFDPIKKDRDHTVAQLDAGDETINISNEDVEKELLQAGMSSLLIVLYEGVDDHIEFEKLLEDAILKVREQSGVIPGNITVTIDIEREIEKDELQNKLQNSDDIDVDEFLAYFRVDPESAASDLGYDLSEFIDY